MNEPRDSTHVLGAIRPHPSLKFLVRGRLPSALHTVLALDLARMPPATAKAGWRVVPERTVRELQGVSCIGFEGEPPPKQEVACTCFFGQQIRKLPPLIEESLTCSPAGRRRSSRASRDTPARS